MCATSPISISKPPQPRPSILCVDDSQEILEICRTILEAGGYLVSTASSGAEALELLQLHSMDAAVIDNIMLGMNGLDLAHQIKSSAPNVLVVMYSGTLRNDESIPFVDACLPKGEGPLALRKLLGLLLQKQSANSP
jgi:CheY-like chemotaxis protein